MIYEAALSAILHESHKRLKNISDTSSLDMHGSA